MAWKTLATAWVLMGAMLVVASQPPTPIEPRDVHHASGAPISMFGILHDVTGNTGIVAHAGHGVRVQWGHGEEVPVAGSWVQVEGRIVERAGEPVLVSTNIEVLARPEPATPSWSQLAAEPHAWSDVALQLRGIVQDHRFGDGKLHLELADSLADGHYQLTGVMAWSARCFCMQWHTWEVAPWN